MRLPARQQLDGPASSACRSPTPAGTSRRARAAIGTSTGDARRHRRHQMPHARAPAAPRAARAPSPIPVRRDAAQIVADQVDDHDVLGDVLDRRAQRRGVRRPRQRALDRARRHRVADRAAGTAPGTATPPRPSRPRRYAARAGDVRATASTKKSTGAPSSAPDELRAHARLVDLAGGDRLEAGRARPARCASRSASPHSMPKPLRGRRISQRLGDPSRKRCTGKAFVPPVSVGVLAQHAVGPAARRLGDSRADAVGTGIGIGQVTEPAAADGVGARDAGRDVEDLARADRFDADATARSPPASRTSRRSARRAAAGRGASRGGSDRPQHLRGAAAGRRAARSAPAQLVRRSAADLPRDRRRRRACPDCASRRSGVIRPSVISTVITPSKLSPR